MNEYMITDSSGVKVPIEAISPLVAVAVYIEENLPERERLVIRGCAFSDHAVIRTHGHKIEARLAEVPV